MTTTESTLSPGWGQKHIIPGTARAAFGARLIVESDGSASLVHDRQGWGGPDRAVRDLISRLNGGILRESLDAIRDLIGSGIMRSSAGEPFVLHDDGEVVVVADTNGSFGYAYLTAFLD